MPYATIHDRQYTARKLVSYKIVNCKKTCTLQITTKVSTTFYKTASSSEKWIKSYSNSAKLMQFSNVIETKTKLQTKTMHWQIQIIFWKISNKQHKNKVTEKLPCNNITYQQTIVASHLHSAEPTQQSYPITEKVAWIRTNLSGAHITVNLPTSHLHYHQIVDNTKLTYIKITRIQDQNVCQWRHKMTILYESVRKLLLNFFDLTAYSQWKSLFLWTRRLQNKNVQHVEVRLFRFVTVDRTWNAGQPGHACWTFGCATQTERNAASPVTNEASRMRTIHVISSTFTGKYYATG